MEDRITVQLTQAVEPSYTRALALTPPRRWVRALSWHDPEEQRPDRPRAWWEAVVLQDLEPAPDGSPREW